jgi:hypothetical protein
MESPMIANTSKRTRLLRIAVVLASILLAAAWLKWRQATNGESRPSAANARAGATDAKSATIIVAPTTQTSITPSPPTSVVARNGSATGLAYGLVASSKTAIDALRRIREDSTFSIPERKYNEALLAETCSDYALANPINPSPKTEQDVARNRRVELSYARFCEGMERLSEIQRAELWDAAARAGDKRAIALLAWRDEFARSPSAAGQAIGEGKPAPLLTEATTRRIVDALATQDAGAINYFGPALSRTSESNYLSLRDGSLALGELPDGTWPMLACDFGMDCSRDNSMLLAACARENICRYDTVESFFRAHVWTQTQAERFDQARAQLQHIISTGATDGLQIKPFPQTARG